MGSLLISLFLQGLCVRCGGFLLLFLYLCFFCYFFKFIFQRRKKPSEKNTSCAFPDFQGCAHACTFLDVKYLISDSHFALIFLEGEQTWSREPGNCSVLSLLPLPVVLNGHWINVHHLCPVEEENTEASLPASPGHQMSPNGCQLPGATQL